MLFVMFIVLSFCKLAYFHQFEADCILSVDIAIFNLRTDRADFIGSLRQRRGSNYVRQNTNEQIYR